MTSLSTPVLLIIFVVVISGCIQQISETPVAGQASIGYIGCSNTRQTIQGYQVAGGGDLWSADERNIHEYDGGAVLDWAEGAEKGNRLWDIFDRYVENNPHTTAVWWQLCIRKEEADMTYEDALPVLDAVRNRIPGVMVYVSPLPEFPEHVCGITGAEGIERAQSLAQELDSRNGDVVAGPIVGPLRPDEIMEDDESRCHSNEEGTLKTGGQLKEFFDELQMEDDVGEDIFEERGETTRGSAENDSEELDSPAQIPAETGEPLTPEERVWRDRIEAALAPASCPPLTTEPYPASYYQGPLTDTHLHIPAIPDWPPEEKMTEVPEGRFGGPQALLGWNVQMSDIACTIAQEGTRRNFAFFPVYEGEISLHLLEIWKRTMEEYPGHFTPFIMSSGNDDQPDGFPTVDAETLQEMLAVYPGLFDGYGEIGLYARENGGSPELPPDAQRLLEIYPLARENNLVVYFHLGDGHKDNFETALQQNPDISFIWHGDQLPADDIEDILSTHPNAYYGIDAFWGHDRDLFLLFVGDSKEAYMDTLNARFDTVLNYAVSDWKAVAERHPDQVLWGIDRGDAVWNYDADVGRLQVKLARAFIGELDPAVQEKIAYQNAERLISD